MLRTGVAAALVLLAAAVAAAQASLDAGQRAQLLAESLSVYDRAIALLRTDPSRARELFGDAARRLQHLADQGVVNGRLQYNLGNAYLQAGDVGRAILSYRRAEQLLPGDPRLQSNLRYARGLVRNRVEESGRRALVGALFSWHDRVPLRGRCAVFAGAYLAFWGVLTVATFRRLPLQRPLAVVLAVSWVASGASVAIDLAAPAGASAGVILADGVVVRKGNGEGYEPMFEEPLGQGTEFELLEERGGWLHVELADGNRGWVRGDQAALVGGSRGVPGPAAPQGP
jgi:hypothetical protein